MISIDKQLKKGVLDIIVLKLLSERVLNTEQIMRRQMTDDR